MTGLAFLRHRALVGLGMAEAAVSLICHVGTDLVTGGTILGRAGVLSLENKPGLRGMIKVFRVERPDIEVGALMLLVAGFAIPDDLAMDAFIGCDPVGNRLVASQTTGGFDFLPVGVAFPAVRFSCQRAVRLRERAGSGELGLRLLAGEGEKGNQEQAADAGRKGEERGRIRSFRTIGFYRPARRHPQSFHYVRFSRANPYNSYNKYKINIL